MKNAPELIYLIIALTIASVIASAILTVIPAFVILIIAWLGIVGCASYRFAYRVLCTWSHDDKLRSKPRPTTVVPFRGRQP